MGFFGILLHVKNFTKKKMLQDLKGNSILGLKHSTFNILMFYDFHTFFIGFF